MPNAEFRDLTDGDPKTEYEDTDTVHDRTGFHVDDDDKLRTEPQPEQSGIQSDLSPAVTFKNRK